MIDSATPYQFELPEYRGFYSMWKRASALLPAAARTSSAGSRYEAASASCRLGLATPHVRSILRHISRQRAVEFLQLPTVFNQAKALDDLYGKPLGVLTATAGQMSGWTAAQDKLARLSRNGFHRTAVGATHEALLEDKAFAQMTSRAITEVVSRARSGRRS